MELDRPVNKPLTGKPMNGKEEAKTGRAADEYRTNFWNMMRSKAPMPAVVNALQIGTDSEGGYLVPDEYERTLVEALEEENIFRQLAKVIQTSSGDRKIRWWHPRELPPGSMRKEPTRKAMTPLRRYLLEPTSWGR
mgnify:CR=1 FL=1